MNQFPEECHVRGCPCHRFALKTPQDGSGEPVREIDLPSPRTSPNPSQTQKNPLSDGRTAQNPLRGVGVGFGASEGLHNQRGPSTAASGFEHDWLFAPSGRKRRVEQEDALYWYTTGARAREGELLELWNEDLRELLRLARERIEH